MKNSKFKTRLRLLGLGIFNFTFLILNCPATSVFFPVSEMTGMTNDVTLNVRAVNNPVIYNGRFYYQPRLGTNLTTVGGFVTNSFVPGRYTVTVAGLQKAWNMYVTNSSATLSAVDLSSAITIYSGIQSITGRSIEVTNDGLGHLTITDTNSGSGFPLTADGNLAGFSLTNGGTVSASNVWDKSNVKWWGAVGDGVTDDTAAVQAAYNYQRTNGGLLYFPASATGYKFNLLVTNNNITLRGDTINSTFGTGASCVPADLTRPIVQVGDDSGLVYGFHMENMSFQAANATNALYMFGGAFNSVIENCGFYSGANSVKVEGGASYPASLITFQNCVFSGGTNSCFWFNNPASGSYATAVTLNSCHISGAASGFAVRIEGGQLNSVSSYYDMADNHGIWTARSGYLAGFYENLDSIPTGEGVVTASDSSIRSLSDYIRGHFIMVGTSTIKYLDTTSQTLGSGTYISDPIFADYQSRIASLQIPEPVSFVNEGMFFGYGTFNTGEADITAVEVGGAFKPMRIAAGSVDVQTGLGSTASALQITSNATVKVINSLGAGIEPQSNYKVIIGATNGGTVWPLAIASRNTNTAAHGVGLTFFDHGYESGGGSPSLLGGIAGKRLSPGSDYNSSLHFYLNDTNYPGAVEENLTEAASISITSTGKMVLNVKGGFSTDGSFVMRMPTNQSMDAAMLQAAGTAGHTKWGFDAGSQTNLVNAPVVYAGDASVTVLTNTVAATGQKTYSITTTGTNSAVVTNVFLRAGSSRILLTTNATTDWTVDAPTSYPILSSGTNYTSMIENTNGSSLLITNAGVTLKLESGAVKIGAGNNLELGGNQIAGWNDVTNFFTQIGGGGGVTPTNTTGLPGVVTDGGRGIGTNLSTLATTAQLQSATNNLDGQKLLSLSVSNAAIANSTINSNKFDAATRALFGAGGASGGVYSWTNDVNANEHELTQVTLISGSTNGISPALILSSADTEAAIWLYGAPQPTLYSNPSYGHTFDGPVTMNQGTVLGFTTNAAAANSISNAANLSTASFSAPAASIGTLTLDTPPGTGSFLAVSNNAGTNYLVVTNAPAGGDVTSAQLASATNNLNGTAVTVGTVADARIASTITRDTEWDTIAEIVTATGSDIVTNNRSGTLTIGKLISNGQMESYGAVSVTTNSWATNTALTMVNGYQAALGANTGCGIPGVVVQIANKEQYASLTIKASGDVTFTNTPGIKFSDYSTSRVITNGNFARIDIVLIPGFSTNAFISQTR